MTIPAQLTWLFLPTAFVLGMAHALEPGHGKTLVASYLIGIRGKTRDAIMLGLTVTFTHTVVIFLLAFAVLAFGAAFPLTQVQHWLEVVSAALVFAMGLWLLRTRWREWKQDRQYAAQQFQPVEHDDHHSHSHGLLHGHHHHHSHSHDLPIDRRLSFRQLVSFGFSGGLVPCPAALAILILAVGMGKPALGLVTVAVFSVGLALALVVIGIGVCKGVGFFGKRFEQSKWTKRLPVISSGIVTLLGLLMLVKALSGEGHLQPQTQEIK
jgi:nickel/cobalt exporter